MRRAKGLGAVDLAGAVAFCSTIAALSLIPPGGAASGALGPIAVGGVPSLRVPHEIANKQVVFVRRDGIYVARADGSRLRKIDDIPGVFEYQPDWSPDGRWIAVRVDEGCPGKRCGTWLVSASGGRRFHLSKRVGVPGGAADWSPDSKSVAYIGKRKNDRFFGIFVVAADGSSVRRVTPDTWEAQYPAWSPLGAIIAFARVRPPSSWDLYVVRSDGSGLKRLRHGTTEDNYPAWSPDGSRLVYSRVRQGPAAADLGLWVLTARDTPRFLTHGGEPQWEPGSWIVFDCPNVAAGASCVVRPDGSGLSRLPLPAGSVFPNWVPPAVR